MVLTTKTDQCYLALGLMVVILLILYKLEYSRLGLIWKSIGMADNLALSLEVNVAAYKLLAFAVGCFFAGCGWRILCALRALSLSTDV